MSPEDKYVSQEALQYFVNHTDGLVVRNDQEITSPEFASENNIIVVWGAGEKIKCVAPSNVDYNTKFVYLGTSAYYTSPTDIVSYGSGTGQEVIYGSSSEYSLYRTRSTTSDPWPPYFSEIDGDPAFLESEKRTNYQTYWVKTNGTTNTSYACTTGNKVYGDPAVGTLSPSNQISTGTSGNSVTMTPVFGYNS